MKQLARSLQLVIKEEVERDSLSTDPLKRELIHVGLGHSVFNVTPDARPGLDALLERLPEDKFYFRLSFVEDLSVPTGTSRSYLTHDAKFFKPKVNQNILYFLGLNFVIVEIARLDRSEKFNIDNYHCKIVKITVDPVSGSVQDEPLWEKTKFGRIETYLPAKLKQFSAPVYQCRRRLLHRTDGE